MNREMFFYDTGYEQGFRDGQITKGIINKKYIERSFESVTQDLSNLESQQYKMGWQEGFVDAVRGAVKSVVLQEDCVKKHLDTIFDIG